MINHQNQQHQQRRTKPQQRQQDEVSCTVLAARNKPFAVPKALIHLPFFNISCEVADSAPGTVAMLITKTPPTDIHQQQQLMESMQQRAANSNISGGGGGGGGGVTSSSSFSLVEGSSMIIQRITHTSALSQPTDKIAMWRVARFLKLIGLINPHLCPNILPVIASYRYRHDKAFISRTAAPTASNAIIPSPASRGQAIFLNNNHHNVHSKTSVPNYINNSNIINRLDMLSGDQDDDDDREEALYICQPHMEETLAAAARAAPTTTITPNQLRVIARELLDAMALLHKNNIVILDMNPTNVRVNLALKSRSDVAICVSRPVLAGVPMHSKNFLRLLDLPKLGHRYLAPEVVAQIANAMTSKSSVVADADIFSLPDASTITVSAASDVWSLGCLLAELVLGRPLFPSNSTFDHPAVVSQVLSQPFPDLSVVLNQQVPMMIQQASKYYSSQPSSPTANIGNNNNNNNNDLNQTLKSLNDTLSGTFSNNNQQRGTMTGGSNSSSSSSPSPNSRLGMFSGVQISSHLVTAFHGQENSFKQLIAAMLQIDPLLRPTAEEVIRSPFISMTSSSGGSGMGTTIRQLGGGGGTGSTISGGGNNNNQNLNLTVGTRVYGGQRNFSGTTPTNFGVAGRGGVATSENNNNQQFQDMGRMRSADFPSGGGGGGILLDFGHEWAIRSPEDEAVILKEIEEIAPLLP